MDGGTLTIDQITDAHVHVGRSIQGFAQDATHVLAEMERLGVSTAVLVPVRSADDYGYGSQNDLVASLRTTHLGRFHALGRVDPRLASAAAEATRCFTELACAGLYIHPWEDAISVADPRLDPVLRVCAAHGAPVLIAAGYPWVSEAAQIADLAGRFPEVPIVMTNGGQINVSGLGQRDAYLALEQHANVHMTTSGVYRQDFIEEVLSGLGPGKVLFGSQSPLFDQDFELRRVLWAHVGDDVKRAVLWENAQRLFGSARAQVEGTSAG